MSKALLDTTVLTDILLKPDKEGVAAQAAVRRYTETLLPQYAIKEFKQGPFKHYVWFHNKVKTCRSFAEAVKAIGSVFRMRNKSMTALNALAQFQTSIANSLPQDWAQRYPGQTLDQIQRAEAELWLKTRIHIAWSKRRKIATRVIGPLSCYAEADFKTTPDGQIICSGTCSANDCCLRLEFIATPQKLHDVLAACGNLPPKQETDRRRKALKQLVKHPNKDLEEKHCRSLGDAVFAMQCPNDAEILTTNISDHDPLARAVGVRAVAP